MKYTVMSADQEVAVVNNNEVTILDERLAPLYLKRTLDFEKWISDRAIDSTRPNSRLLKKFHGLSRNASDFETAMLYNAACVTDNFWVRKGNETWDDVKFDNDMYFKAAISSDVDAFDRAPSKSPELTNIGSREKGWKNIDGEWWLYKNEPEQQMRFEWFTSKLGESLGMDMAYYTMDGGYICTRDVTKGKVNLQAIDALVYDHDGVVDENMKYNYQTLYEIHPDLAHQYMDMKYLDVLVNNVDRHTKNYAVLTSQETGEILKLAPNYDNDMAFYGFPDILHKNRMHGEMKEFLELLNETDYIPPRIDKKIVREILDAAFLKENVLGEGNDLMPYLLEGEQLVFDRIKQCYQNRINAVQNLADEKGYHLPSVDKLDNDLDF